MNQSTSLDKKKMTFKTPIISLALFSLVAAIAVVRFPDTYTRNQAASKSATLGVLCILLGIFMYYLLIKHLANPTKGPIRNCICLYYFSNCWSPHHESSLQYWSAFIGEYCPR
jgi:monovalent cation/proton antiporter MnhG/PhaG subunit